VDLVFVPPERLVENGVVPCLMEKMQHPYLKRHPNLVRTRSIHSETDFALVASEGIEGVSLMSLAALRGRFSAADVCHLSRQLDRLLIHLDDATAIEFGGLDPWRVLIHFNGELSADQRDQLLGVMPVTEWTGAELRVRIETLTDALVEPVGSAWRYLLEQRMNGRALATLALWMLEGERFRRLLAENRADAEPLCRHPGLDELFRTAAVHLEESDPAQRRRFLEMLEAKTIDALIETPERDAEAHPEPKKKPRRNGLFRRQRSMISSRR